MLAEPLYPSNVFQVRAVGVCVPWDNDDGLHALMGLVLYGYAVYSNITGAFWQICHKCQKGFPKRGYP
jgi:hypothetical protein